MNSLIRRSAVTPCVLVLLVPALAGSMWLAPSISDPAGPVRDAHTEVTLFAEQQAVEPGEAIMLGLRMRIDEHWHTYWRNSGDSGMPPTLRWELPEGFEAGDILWPHPERFDLEGLVSYGYKDEVLLPVRISVPDRLDAERVKLTVHADWLTCKEICLPGEATLSVELPVQSSAPAANSAVAELFAAAQARLPRPLDRDAGERVRVRNEGEGLVLRAAGLVDADTEIADAYFYAGEGRKLHYGAPQQISRENGAFSLTLTPSPLRTAGDGAIERLEGVLVVDTGETTRAYAVDVPVEAR